MKVRIFTVLLIFLAAHTPAQQSIEKALQVLMSDPDYHGTTVGIQVSEIYSDKILYAFNNEKLMIPASTMKLVTSAAALEILGANYRFTTHIGYTGIISENTLKGNLVVVGGGDPALGSEYFKDFYENPHFLDVWARKIKDSGIQNVKGDLIMDGSLYDSEKIPPTWIWEDMGNYYGAGASALTVYDNMFRIRFSSPAKAGNLTKIISTYPKIDGLKIKNKVLSSDENRDLAYVFGSPLDENRTIRGTIPKNRQSFTIKAAVQLPEKLLAESFVKHLAKAGVFVSGEIKFVGTNHKKLHTIFLQESPVLKDIVKVLNYESVNLFAEHLVKQIAAETVGEGNREKGIEIIKEFWKSKGVGDHFFMEDGSGLSHFNAVSPSQFISLLKYMNSSENAEVFFNSLPNAGSGTLYGFDSNLFPQNTLKAKSGSMTRVRCYVGYLKTDSDNTVVFSIMFNHFGGSHAKLTAGIQNLLSVIKMSF